MRRKRNYKREHKPDAKHGSVAVSRFVNYIMESGKKSIAETIIYDALDIVAKETKENPLTVFEKALDNAAPIVEVVSQRVGGANYQVPREVRADRRFVLAARWILEIARGKKGMKMSKKLAGEIIAAFKNEGEVIKKKQNTHRMAEANRAFAHFARRQ